MTTATSPLAYEADTARPRNRRNSKDVPGLADTSAEVPLTLSQAFQQLAQAGFSVYQPSPTHWVTRVSTPLPEFHCYSEQEILLFTANRT